MRKKMICRAVTEKPKNKKSVMNTPVGILFVDKITFLTFVSDFKLRMSVETESATVVVKAVQHARNPQNKNFFC